MGNRLPEGMVKRKAEITADALLDVIQGLIDEMPTVGQQRNRLDLDSRLERDLGLDSLARTELIARINERFNLLMPDEGLLAETPRALLILMTQVAGVPGTQVTEARPSLPDSGVSAPTTASTLMEVLSWHLDHQPKRLHILHYGSDENPDELSYQDLWSGASRVASSLWQRSIRPGDRVALMLPTGESYFFSFFGTLLAGAVPVPIYPPTRPSQLEEHLTRHSRLLQNAGVRLLITIPAAHKVAHLLKIQVPSLRHIVDWNELDSGSGTPPSVLRQADDIAFLQYTSGSTGDPKGVMLTHADLLANIRAMGEAVQVTPDDVFISWLPLYHDMGLIGAWLGSLYFGMPLVVMSPLHFLAHPARWLWAIHHHRGTLSASPNFGYELCLNKVSEEEIAGLDLSSWRFAFNGAEPVTAATMQGFAERFEPYGFDGGALAPVYGLAESAVGLAFPPPRRGTVIDWINRDRFMLDGEAVPVSENDPDPMAVVGCGRALNGYQVQVVNGNNEPLPDRMEGRLEFKGPSATRGYFENPAATAKLFRDGWVDTGDRAYLADGEIFITGRLKEMIIRGGRNIYPYELEQQLGELDGIRKGCVALFPSSDPATGSERLIVLAETRETDQQRKARLRQAILECSTDLLGMPPDDLLLAPPHTVLKTSSGKLRRGAMRELYERGELGRRQRPLVLQVMSLLLSGMGRGLRSLYQRAKSYLFAGYAWMVFYILAPLVWLSVLLLPRLSWRWAVVRWAIRILRGLTATPLRVEGIENLPSADQPVILVANHSSYLDTLALIDGLPRDFIYVAKQELASKSYVRQFLQRLDTLFVERIDSRRSVMAVEEFASQLAAGRSLAFYPEGTFRAEPGLLPFRMGAFVAATQNGIPVVPVTIRGTRAILKSDSNFPHHGAVRIIIGAALEPKGDDWAEAVRLKDVAREVIAHDCNERNLGFEDQVDLRE
ncbi:MAG: AMP-binding protein [Candidatus Thiodiazotropha lotti]|uniref:AMP-binding protein n=1 Tax=Candidatus Thiodiazotropha endoloripes TaxID=1818881 RepID=UPI000B04FA1C|nr:AMP-binding protein [Candidatus Thiodiazotropha endoloripes]MCG7992133.1 AMP-binding protein [Candidatus Thiodiazotropha lotti]MCG7998638.1 AMP-binding protein [Candidatus Thiodiazotropha lotti]MCW4183791.1 AMP-binding protein [Candidatus Thiodiazotropha weberae]MCW4190404.1 AMP-binding protein [Candidatus Thiodiazotropha weberae]